jgi:hypothetical protein
MTLNQIIFEHIDDKYAYGKYGDFKVIMMMKNRYINATRLCNESKRRFDNWLRNESNKQLINFVNNKLDYNSIPQNRGIENNNLIANKIALENNKSIIIIKGGNNQLICGTYVHELLIPHIACWISPEFGIKVSEIVNSFISNEYINLITVI